MKVWVSARADRLNQQDRLDFDAFGKQAIANGGDAYINGFYHAYVDGDNVYVVTYSEEEGYNVHKGE